MLNDSSDRDFLFKIWPQNMHVCMLVALSRSTLCNPMDCSPPGSSVHRLLQARILEWVAIPFSRESSWPRDQTKSPALQADYLSYEESPLTPARTCAMQIYLCVCLYTCMCLYSMLFSYRTTIKSGAQYILIWREW